MRKATTLLLMRCGGAQSGSKGYIAIRGCGPTPNHPACASSGLRRSTAPSSLSLSPIALEAEVGNWRDVNCRCRCLRLDDAWRSTSQHVFMSSRIAGVLVKKASHNHLFFSAWFQQHRLG
jgi:hypothetical protein